MEFLSAVGLAALAAAIGYVLGRRGTIGRIEERITPEAEVPIPAGLVVEDVEPEPIPAKSSVDGIERALADLRLGVVVVAQDGFEVYRNNRAEEYATGRHGDALVDAALERVIDGALLGLSLEESVEIYGPPARSILVQASPTYEAGELAGAVGVIDDVTEFRHMLRVRSDFVANVSHELRTPVGAMSVLAETIADNEDPEIVHRLSHRMLREATRLADTIEDLLTLSRLESGPVEDPETIDLVSVAAMAVERTSEAAAQRPVEVRVDADGHGPVLIDGDQGQLVSAVANLVDNAIKYSEADGLVEIHIRSVSGPGASAGARSLDDSLDGYRSGDDHEPAPDRAGAWLSTAKVAELSVFDHGIGVPERDLERIFERFYRVDSGRSRETGGTGLGLSIVRHVLLNHRGTVDVDSVEGRGTTFTIRLPLSAAQGQLAPGAGSTAARHQRTALEQDRDRIAE